MSLEIEKSSIVASKMKDLHDKYCPQLKALITRLDKIQCVFFEKKEEIRAIVQKAVRFLKTPPNENYTIEYLTQLDEKLYALLLPISYASILDPIVNPVVDPMENPMENPANPVNATSPSKVDPIYELFISPASSFPVKRS